MAFFGRLFEHYIQDATEDACKNDYIYIDEFEFKVKRDTRKSSDLLMLRLHRPRC